MAVRDFWTSYDEEVDRLIKLGSWTRLAELYLTASYSLIDQAEDFIKKETYETICDALNTNWTSIPHMVRNGMKREDLENATCTLTQASAAACTKGTHYPREIDEAADYLDKRIHMLKGVCEIDFSPG